MGNLERGKPRDWLNIGLGEEEVCATRHTALSSRTMIAEIIMTKSTSPFNSLSPLTLNQQHGIFPQ